MTLQHLITLAQKFSDLGDAVQEQMQDVLDGKACDINPNAWTLLKKFLRRVQDVADQDLAVDIEELIADTAREIDEAANEQ